MNERTRTLLMRALCPAAKHQPYNEVTLVLTATKCLCTLLLCPTLKTTHVFCHFVQHLPLKFTCF